MSCADHFSEFYLNVSPVQIPHFLKLVYFLGNFPGRWKKTVPCDAQKSDQKDSRVGLGKGAVFQNI